MFSLASIILVYKLLNVSSQFKHYSAFSFFLSVCQHFYSYSISSKITFKMYSYLCRLLLCHSQFRQNRSLHKRERSYQKWAYLSTLLNVYLLLSAWWEFATESFPSTCGRGSGSWSEGETTGGKETFPWFLWPSHRNLEQEKKWMRSKIDSLWKGQFDMENYCLNMTSLTIFSCLNFFLLN